MIQHDPCLCSICIGGFLSYTYMLLMIANLIHDHRFESAKNIPQNVTFYIVILVILA